jgi:hypothetical protein
MNTKPQKRTFKNSPVKKIPLNVQILNSRNIQPVTTGDTEKVKLARIL